MFRPFDKIHTINGHKLIDNWFTSCETDAWFPQWKWTTPKQDKFNAAHTSCPKCKGWGTAFAGDNIGCSRCHGTGSISNV